MVEPSSAHWVALAAWITFVGLLQLTLGVVRFGWLLNLVTSPVLGGFTQAAALLILASQLPALLGLRTSWSALASSPSLQHFDFTALAFGLGSWAFWCWPSAGVPVFPPPSCSSRWQP